MALSDNDTVGQTMFWTQILTPLWTSPAPEMVFLVLLLFLILLALFLVVL